MNGDCESDSWPSLTLFGLSSLSSGTTIQLLSGTARFKNSLIENC